MRLNTSSDIMPLVNRRRLYSQRSLSVGEFASRRKASEENYYNCSPIETDDRESILCPSRMSNADPAALEGIIGKQFKMPTRKISVVERTGVKKVIPRARSISVGENAMPLQGFQQLACSGPILSPREGQPKFTNLGDAQGLRRRRAGSHAAPDGE
ncbi:uncharacterized protein LOC135489651 isoform X2 [Lineus longissimus]|uniref:uncharacterized protein LOC135489651 isoform X2 n=1 Tax=Lineus longissimus TaxID=88925 RepID=UPI00315DE15A